MGIGLDHTARHSRCDLGSKGLHPGGLGSERPGAIRWVGLWSAEIVKDGTLLNREGTAKDRGKGEDKATADFSTTAASAPPPVEMTILVAGLCSTRIRFATEDAVRNYS
jgi:hypothetical protein